VYAALNADAMFDISSVVDPGRYNQRSVCIVTVSGANTLYVGTTEPAPGYVGIAYVLHVPALNDNDPDPHDATIDTDVIDDTLRATLRTACRESSVTSSVSDNVDTHSNDVSCNITNNVAFYFF